MRAEFSSKIEGEVTKFQKAMDKQRSDTAIEILSASNIWKVCEKLDDRLTGHIEETDRHMDRITEERKAKTKVLEIDLGQHVENTDGDIQSLRQESSNGAPWARPGAMPRGPKWGVRILRPPKKGPGSVAHFLFFNLNFC